LAAGPVLEIARKKYISRAKHSGEPDQYERCFLFTDVKSQIYYAAAGDRFLREAVKKVVPFSVLSF
jgi:hypothetical protein